MKKLILGFSLILVVITSCNNDNKKLTLEQRKAIKKTIIAPAGWSKEAYLNYLAFYGSKWSFYEVKSKKTLSVFKKYFKNIPYKVIWHWDIDGDGYKDSLAVEVFQKVNRGIKRGILVDENGKIKLFIDTVRGVYAPDYKKGGFYTIVDLSRLGIQNEISCYSIGYISPKMANYNYNHAPISITTDPAGVLALSKIYRIKFDKFYESKKGAWDRLRLVNLNYYYSNFYLTYIDRELQSIDEETIYTIYIPGKGEIKLKPSTGHFNRLEDYYRYKRNIVIKEYRKAKRMGKVFSPPTKFNPEHVKKALQLELN